MIPRYVLDPSAIEASFFDAIEVEGLIADADAGLVHLYLPAVAVAEVETALHAGIDGWSHLLYNLHVDTVALQEAGALEIGGWPGQLAARQAVLEARRLGASVVTSRPALYEGLPVALRVF